MGRFFDLIDEPYQLICRIIYISAKMCRLRLRVSDRYQNMLSLTINKINFEDNSISFKQNQTYHTGSDIVISLPQTIMNELKSHIGKKTQGLVFTSKVTEEKELYPNQVERALAKASKQLGLDFVITPVILSWAGVLSYEITSKTVVKALNG